MTATSLDGAGLIIHGDPIPVTFDGEVAIAVSQTNGASGSLTLTADNRLRVDTRPTYEDRNLFVGSAWRMSSPFSQSAW